MRNDMMQKKQAIGSYVTIGGTKVTLVASDVTKEKSWSDIFAAGGAVFG